MSHDIDDQLELANRAVLLIPCLNASCGMPFVGFQSEQDLWGVEAHLSDSFLLFSW